ncbi:MAG: hypothetical protein IJF32_11400 [Oscillospiraceae bacterium]|nr:hypothetical protein [Oscillospiraceae bacterium]
MSKAMLHDLIDMLNETDMETIYNVLVRFVPGAKPYADEVSAIAEAQVDIKNGDVFNLADISW